MLFQTKPKLKRVHVSAVIIRADGSTENLGIVADSDKNPNLLQRSTEWLAQRLS